MINKTTKTILLIFGFLVLYTTTGFSQNNQRYSAFIKAQYVPSIGINFKITNHISLRPALLIEGRTLLDALDVALLFDIFESKKITYYIGSSLTPFIGLKGSYSIGLLAGTQLQLSNKFSLFAELASDLSVSSNGRKNIHFKKSGVGINYYLGK